MAQMDITPVKGKDEWEKARSIRTQVFIEEQLERFAMLPEHRGQGHGTYLVRHVLEDARRAGFDTFLVHAQSHLQDWYEDLGFRATGRTFEEAGIPHIEMVRHEDE